VVAAKAEVERAKARVACCQTAVAFSTEAVTLGQESVSSATQALNSAERSLEFAQAAERLVRIAEEKMLAEVEAAEGMMSETRAAQEFTDNATTFLHVADKAENVAQIYATSARSELEHRVQLLYELNQPSLGNMEQQTSVLATTTSTEYVSDRLLGSNTNAQYDKRKNKILINDRYRDVNEPTLLQPLLAHEEVHAKYKSDAPKDENSLQSYLDEEMEAHTAQLNTWLSLKEDFYRKYPTPKDRESLDTGGQELLEEYLGLEQQINDEGSEGLRKSLEQKYRQRL
jgi:hypothetical protein